MKKRLLATLLAASVAVTMAACGRGGSFSGGGDSADGGEKLNKLGYISAAWSDDYCKRLNDAIVEHGPEYGFEVEALNASPNGMADVTGYIEATEALAQKNIDAILCAGYADAVPAEGC